MSQPVIFRCVTGLRQSPACLQERSAASGYGTTNSWSSYMSMPVSTFERWECARAPIYSTIIGMNHLHNHGRPNRCKRLTKRRLFARAPIGALALRLRTAARALRGHSQVGATPVPLVPSPRVAVLQSMRQSLGGPMERVQLLCKVPTKMQFRRSAREQMYCMAPWQLGRSKHLRRRATAASLAVGYKLSGRTS